MEGGFKNSSRGLPDDLSKRRGPFFSRDEIRMKKNSRGVKNSSHGLTDNLSKVRGYFFSRGEVKISLGNI